MKTFCAALLVALASAQDADGVENAIMTTMDMMPDAPVVGEGEATTESHDEMHHDEMEHHEDEMTMTSEKTEAEKQLEMIWELIEAFCPEEDMEEMDSMGRRLDGHPDDEIENFISEFEEGDIDLGVDIGVDVNEDELCQHAKEFYDEAIRFARADMDTQTEMATGWAEELGKVLEDVLGGSISLTLGVAAASAVTLLSF